MVGLAQTACHPIEVAGLFPSSEFQALSKAGPSALSQVTAQLSHLLLNAPPAPAKKATHPGVHALDIAARIQADARFSVGALELKPHMNPAGGLAHYEKVAALYGAELLAWAEEWLPLGADVDAKIEELAWLSVLLYGVAGWSANGEFNADFFT